MRCTIFILIILLKALNKTINANSACGTELYSLYNTQDNTFCYESTDVDDLPLVDESSWMEDSIYFIDTSCKGGLNIREACSVEAAAKVNPSREVIVLFAGPVTEACVTSEPLVSLLTYVNVQLKRIYVRNFSKETGLEHLFQNSVMNSAPYPNLYALDLLKFITLYKFDGIYMDLDMMATRPFDDLPKPENWLAIGDHKQGTFSSAIFAASSDDVGRKLIESVISILKADKTTDSWRESFESFNVLKKAVEWLNGNVPFSRSKTGFSFIHHGLVIYASKFFFPIPCESSRDYFESRLDTANLTKSFTQQFCNGLTFREIITKESTYAKLMSEFCPRVYEYFYRIGFEQKV